MTMEIAPAMYRSLEEGHPVALPEELTLAVSAEGGIRSLVRLTFSERPTGAVLSSRSVASDVATKLLSAAPAATAS